MAETLDAALEALRRADFYAGMTAAEQQLRKEPGKWDSYISERDEWLNPDLEN